MKTTRRFLLVFAAALVLLAGTGCNKLKARDHLNKGVQAYKNSKFEQAIDHFQQAVALDPSLINARLYLATAFAQQYIPGADTPENNHYGEQAIEQYKQVLQVDPRNINSIKGIAYLYLQMKKFDLAKEYYKKASEVDPNDPEPYYSVAVIDWTQTYVPRQEERAKLGMKPDEALPTKDKKVCATIRERNTANVQEGIDNLKRCRSEDRRRVGRQNHGHQESQGRKTARGQHCHGSEQVNFCSRGDGGLPSSQPGAARPRLPAPSNEPLLSP